MLLSEKQQQKITKPGEDDHIIYTHNIEILAFVCSVRLRIFNSQNLKRHSHTGKEYFVLLSSLAKTKKRKTEQKQKQKQTSVVKVSH